jgi:hypothetical protein
LNSQLSIPASIALCYDAATLESEKPGKSSYHIPDMNEVTMGADAFVVFFGVRHTVPSDEELDRLESRKDQRLIAARKAKLKTYFGRLTDGSPHFLLIGYHVGTFGVENSAQAALTLQQVNEIMEETKQKLQAAGLDKEEPKLYFQFEAQY